MFNVGTIGLRMPNVGGNETLNQQRLTADGFVVVPVAPTDYFQTEHLSDAGYNSGTPTNFVTIVALAMIAWVPIIGTYLVTR